MSRKLRLAYIAHSLRSDWNNGNAHFLRGLMRALGLEGHDVHVLEPEMPWSLLNLLEEPLGAESLATFAATYSDINLTTYPDGAGEAEWRELLRNREIVILHEWNPPELARLLLRLRKELGFKLLFHDTHHRASSSPEQIGLFGIPQFDGVLTFGDVLTKIYSGRFGLTNVWTLHEAADTTVFFPRPQAAPEQEVVWIGNWGDEERSEEIASFLLQPASLLPGARFTIFGVRYPEDGRKKLHDAGVRYGGYLPNLAAPQTYAASRLTVHVPRQQYSTVMTGIPTIRVFEALACGTPLLSAPWQDTEHLFRPGDLRFVHSTEEATAAIRDLLENPAKASDLAAQGLETVLDRHTCKHRAQQLTALCEDLLS